MFQNFGQHKRNNTLPAGMKNDVQFDWVFESYDYLTFQRLSPGDHLMILFYSKIEVALNSEVPFVDTNAFVGAIGGGLGLFLGFSMIDTLLYIYKFVLKIY